MSTQSLPTLELPLRAPSGGLKGYLERARRLLKDAQEGVNPFSGLAVRTRVD